MTDAFSEHQAAEIRRAIERAEAGTDTRFSVYVGAGAAERGFARRGHAAFGPAAARTVLIAVDPAARVVEIVTGARVRRLVDDQLCGIAAMSMATSFSVGDLVAGICDGIHLLGERARRPPTAFDRAPD